MAMFLLLWIKTILAFMCAVFLTSAVLDIEIEDDQRAFVFTGVAVIGTAASIIMFLLGVRP